MFLGTVLALAILAFAMLNQGEAVSAVNLGWIRYSNVSSVMLTLWAFGAGFTICLVYALAHEIGLRLELNRARNQIRALEEEVITLRNLPLDDLEDFDLGDEVPADIDLSLIAAVPAPPMTPSVAPAPHLNLGLSPDDGEDDDLLEERA